MGLEDVEKDILKRVMSKVEVIKSSTEKESREIIDKALSEIEELKKARDSEISTALESIRRREKAHVLLQARKIELEAKKSVIESVYADVEKKIKNMGKKEVENILKILIERARREIEAFYIYSSKKDEELVKKLTKPLGLKYGGNIECIGGVVLENKDGTIGINYTFDSFLEKIKQSTLKEVSRQLFENKLHAEK